ncbi:hypothetical protein V1L54_03040 [Streptomyces sp. TRM 70361]|uniref:hypothetical protein n=1 Tax=Streptomyces sp. TRM 70361 TaxID=3116553 RepID=UPI002E7BECF3|nr:hypothetical protein [Streptomyces sp. TRM 70361]MEE1938397.1 hypothetical protein [Streptomyces sp. TRM 70361]
MERRTVLPAEAGYLMGLGAGTGLVAWTIGAERHLKGGFEGEGRDLSVLYVELPLLVLGVPAAAVAALLLMHGVLDGRVERAAVRRALSAGTALAVAAALVWGGLAWLGATEPPVYQE